MIVTFNCEYVYSFLKKETQLHRAPNSLLIKGSQNMCVCVYVYVLFKLTEMFSLSHYIMHILG